ncbi:hypothetical protein P692DRAFT_20722340, partial [Suillus brevipes Sb2]
PIATRIVSGSRGSTFRLWNATRAQQFQEHTEIHPFCIDIAPFASSQASSLEHALRHNPAVLLETTSHEFYSTGPVLLKDGCIVGADRRLIFWVPSPAREQPLYHPGTVFVIPSGLEIDLRRMTYGGANCRDG